MNKLLVIIAGLLLLTSCGNSEDSRLNNLVAEAVKANLYFPDSYDPVSLECDSMLTYIISDANIRKAAKIVKLMKEAKNLQVEIEMNEEERDYWQGSYGNRHKEYSKKVKQAIEKRDKKIGEAKSLFLDLYSQYTAPCEFCGYFVNHKYRAKNNMGYVMFEETVIILDKNKKSITAKYNAKNESFLYLIQLLLAMQDLDDNVAPEEVDLVEICDNIKSKYDFLMQ